MQMCIFDFDSLKKITTESNLIKEIKSVEALLENGVVIHSPASKMIVYKLETAFDIIVTHEKRHLQQVQRIGKDL